MENETACYTITGECKQHFFVKTYTILALSKLPLSKKGDYISEYIGSLSFEFADEHDTDKMRHTVQIPKSQNRLNTTTYWELGNQD